MTDRRLAAFWHDDFLAHDPPAGEFESEWTGRLAASEPHPDRPERVANVRSLLSGALGDRIDWESPPEATREELERVHDPAYLDDLRAFSAAGGGRLSRTTGANEATYRAAVRAAGAAVAATRSALETGDGTVPYALCRPSGHHAAAAVADGFCFVNNAAVAAESALASGSAERVAIVDWDVHHGNGTQEIFYDRDDVLFVSLHNDHGPWDPETHPQTGRPDERGTGGGEGYTINVPLPPGTGDRGYPYVFDRLVEPAVRAFDPDVLLVSAGGDAGTVDPLGRNLLTKGGFAELGRRARELVEGSVAFVQEGGYQPSHLAYAMCGTMEGALGVDAGIDDPFAWLEEPFADLRPRLDATVEAFADDWPVADASG